MASARTIASKVYMLHDGAIIWGDDVSELEKTDNKFIIQFTRGESNGPISHRSN